jgi:menaquinone-9 beta-reductase
VTGPRDCDVIIVGGGPAGSTLAWRLIRAGLDVVVIDKKAFPRDKVCAGWVTPAVVDALALDLDAYRRGRVLQEIRAFRISMLDGPEVLTRHDAVVSYGIRRCEFDHYLLERSGASLESGETVRDLERKGGRWVVNGRLRAPLLVGAGGHFCPVARRLGADLGGGERVVAAQEVEFPMDERQRAACAVRGDTPELFFCRDLRGYAWVFRKGEFLNIGLGREDNHRLAEHVAAFVGFLQARGRIPADLPGRFKGHAYLLHTHAGREVLGEGALLIGDAAGLAYPQSGEGIRPAVESALLAADTILEAAGDYGPGRLDAYARRLRQRFGRRAHGRPANPLMPPGIRTWIGERLLGTHWFARRVVVDRWFLHQHEPPLAAVRTG